MIYSYQIVIGMEVEDTAAGKPTIKGLVYNPTYHALCRYCPLILEAVGSGMEFR